MYIVTPNVRHLAVRTQPDDAATDARRGTWIPRRARAICGRPMPMRAYEQLDWSDARDDDLPEVLGPRELAKWRRALSRPICTDCAWTLANLRRLERLGVQR